MQNTIDYDVADKLQDVLAAVTRIDSDLESLLNVVELIRNRCDNSQPNEAHGYIRLIKLWMQMESTELKKVMNELEKCLLNF